MFIHKRSGDRHEIYRSFKSTFEKRSTFQRLIYISHRLDLETSTKQLTLVQCSSRKKQCFCINETENKYYFCFNATLCADIRTNCMPQL